MSRIIPFNSDRAAGTSKGVEPGSVAEGEVIDYPRANLRQLFREWADDCIAVGLAKPKNPKSDD